MFRPWIQNLLLISSILLAAGLAQARFNCGPVHRDLTAGKLLRLILKKARQPVPLLLQQDVQSFLMYGFESEYTIAQTGRILNVYAPENMAAAVWQKMSEQEHVEWLQTHLANKRLGDKASGLVKINREEQYSFLPEKPIIDDTGNLELIIGPLNDFTTWQNQVHSINRFFGVGSQQAMVSVPRKALFPEGAERMKALRQVKGAFNFLHEFDVLDRMNEGANRLRKDPTKSVLRTFAHPFLGPMMLAKQHYMNQQLEQLSKGQNVWFDVATAQSSKFIGSTTPRPDIGQNMGRMGAEVRDAHTDEAKLIHNTERITLLFLGDRSVFEDFHAVEAVDTKKAYNLFSPETQKMLEALFPTRRDQTFGYVQAEIFALEVYRNFSYPLKNWTPDLQALKREDLVDQVKMAQTIYLSQITEIAHKYQSGQITKEQAGSQVQGLCALFAQDSGLYQAFKKAHDLLITQVGRDYLQAMAETSGSEVNP